MRPYPRPKAGYGEEEFTGLGSFCTNLSSLFGIISRFGAARRVADFLRGQALFAGDERLAIGEHDQFDTPERLAILGRHQSDGNFIPRFEGRLAPSKTDHFRGVLSLCNPMHYLPAFIHHVKLQEAMGIEPVPFRDVTL